MMMICICDNCNIEFERSNSEISKSIRKGRTHCFCSIECYEEFRASKKVELICVWCKTTFTRNKSDLNHAINRATNKGKKYDPLCSKECQGKHTRRSNNKNGLTKKIVCGKCDSISKTAFNNYNNTICLECASAYCNDCGVKIDDIVKTSKRKRRSKAKYCRDCRHKRALDNGSKGGTKSAEKQVKRSKNEIAFAELCFKEFSNVSTNERCFKDDNKNYWDADVILHEQKVAVLWNGQWHYKQISKKQSLAQVQSRDAIKLKVIESNGYAAYVIKDMGKVNQKLVDEEFNKFVKWIIKGQDNENKS